MDSARSERGKINRSRKRRNGFSRLGKKRLHPPPKGYAALLMGEVLSRPTTGIITDFDPSQNKKRSPFLMTALSNKIKNYCTEKLTVPVSAPLKYTSTRYVPVGQPSVGGSK